MALPACGFAVYADKGGQLPLAIERRAKGKRVTIINGVKGNARALCQSLTSLLGVGGTVHSKGQFFDVEVQGEQTERVSSALRQLACVRGPGGVKLKEPAVVERGCAYDEFLRQEEAPNGRRKERWEAGPREAPEPPENAPCRAWHGYWIYCNGHCEELDNSPVWEDSEEVCVKTESIAPLSPAQLDLVLKRLGLMAAVGPAIESYRLELQAAREERAQPKASFCAVQPPKETTLLTCAECGASFTMRRTLELHKRQHLNAPSSLSSGIEVPAWRWDSMSQARQEADFLSESLPERNTALTSVNDLVNDLDEFLSPEEAQYLVPETSKYTLGSLLEHAVPVSRNRRKKGAPRAATYRPCPVCDVEFPESILEQHVEECLTNSQPQTAAVSEKLEINGTDMTDVLPEELLESLLQMQLPPEASDVFWSAYEFHRERLQGVQEAFLTALEEALSWIPAAKASASGCYGDHDLLEPKSDLDSPASDTPGRPSAAVTCPVRNLDFPPSAIEEHVDQCLGAAASAASAASAAPGEGYESYEALPEARTNRWARRTGRTDAAEALAVKKGVEKDEGPQKAQRVQPSPEHRCANVSDPQESAQDKIKRLKQEAKARKTKTVR